MSATGKANIEASLCERCFEVFFSKKLFEAHVQTCGESAAKTSPSASRMVSSTLSKCATCRRIFLGGQNLAKHIKREHGTKKIVRTVISCYECKKLFTDAETLAKHKEQEHPHAPSSSTAVDNIGMLSPKPKVLKVTRSFPKTPKTDAAPEQKMKSSVNLTKTLEAKTKPDAKSKLDSESCPNTQPELDSKTPSTDQEFALPPEPLVSMPVLDVGQDSSNLLDDLMVEQRSETVEAQADAVDTTSGAESLPMQEGLSSPDKPLDEEPQAPAKKISTDKPPTGSDDSPAEQQTTGPVIPSRAPNVAHAISTVTSASSMSPAAASTAAKASSSTTAPGLFFACGSCNFMFADKEMMLNHLSEKHGHQVASDVRSKPAVSRAIRPGSGITLYACAFCNAKYGSVELVKAHIEAAHRTPRSATAPVAATRRDTVWWTQECEHCASLFQPSVRLRDIYMNLSEWMNHFYGPHGTTEKIVPRKQLDLRPCHRCGLVFFSNATRLHHNAVSHDGKDPEAEMKQKQQEERELVKLATAQITPKSLTAKARSRVIVDSLMKASLVSRSTPAVIMNKATAQKAQSKVFAARSSSSQRVTNVVFKCSKCGGMFPDDPSFERHAREAHRGERTASPPPVQFHPPPATETEKWDVLRQRECTDCSKLMESCPRSFALFVRRDVWERHVNEVHLTGRWRCTGEVLNLHPCPHCPRLFMHPNTLEAHQTKLHDTMLGPVDQAAVDACTPTKTLECSRCSQLVQNADGIRFLDGTIWNNHFETEHKELLLCDGKAGEWDLFSCSKCPRLFFNERDIPTHEARQAYMHMTMPINAKVVTQKRGPRTVQETEIMYQCANESCSFTCLEHGEMVTHFQQCQVVPPTKVGETLLFKTVMVRKPQKPRRYRAPNREPTMRRLENVMRKLAPGSDANGDEASAAPSTGDPTSETAAAVSQLLENESVTAKTPAVLELDPVTCQPRSAHALEAAEDVPEAAAEEETVAADEPPVSDSSAAATRPTRMDFACSVCKMRGSTREAIAAHIRRDHKRSDGTFGPPTRETLEKQQRQLRKYKSAYLCSECKGMAEPCQRTRDLYFEKDAWLNHLATSHKPANFTELDRLDLHECEECQRLFLSHASLKRHSRAYHEPGAENYRPPPLEGESKNEKHKFSCFEEGCTFKYHRVTRLRSHLISEHNFDLAVREVVFNNENDFQEWKKTLELATSAYFVLRSNVQSKRKNGTFNVRYFCCSRVMGNLPSFKENGKKRSLPWQVDLLKEDMVWRCPAFMKAEVAATSSSIHVSFCPNHYGHDMDPSFGRLSDADEAEIGGMLRAGLSIQDVLKRMREEGRRQGTPNRKQRVTEAEINRIFEKYMGMKPPKSKRFDPSVGKAVSRSLGAATDLPDFSWNADLVTSYDDGAMAVEDDTAGDELSLDDSEAVDDRADSQDVWQRVCGEEGCRFTTTSVGFLRSHLRQRHGFAMHIDTAGFSSMKDFTRWKRNLEKRTCAKYTCYKSVAPSDPSAPVVTRYFTCHRSGLNSLKRTTGSAALPRRLVLCTGYMKVRCDSSTGEVACEYCASHYGHDARLANRRVAQHETSDLTPIDYETAEVDENRSPPGVSHFGSPTVTRYSFIQDATASDQELEEERPRRRRGRPPKKRPAAPRRSRGGKRRRWEEFEELEEEEEEEEHHHDESFESD